MAIKVTDRVKTPMPVNAPTTDKSKRMETNTGTVIRIDGQLVKVRMDGHGLVTTWVSDTLEVI